MTENKKKTPYKVGEVLSLGIGDLGHDGRGVGKINGFTFFVPGVLPGEKATIKIDRVHKSYAEATLLVLDERSEHRVSPRCPYFGSCGGCQLQHLAYDKQLAWKEKRVTETLRRIAAIKVPVNKILGMDNPWRYRNKAIFQLGIENEVVVSGFFARKSRRIVAIEDCPLQNPINIKVMNIVRRALQKELTIGKLEKKAILPFSALEVRSSFSTGNSLAALVGSSATISPTLIENLAGQIRIMEIGTEIGIAIKVNKQKNKAVSIIKGDPYIEEIVDLFRYRISAQSFFQVNPIQAKLLCEKVISLAGRPRITYDLYCGTGNFSLYLAQAASEVIGIDSERRAIADARINAALNGIKNCRFISARAEEIPSLIENGTSPDTVLLNPPRNGSSRSLLDMIVKADPERIIYISCNPATLARDLAYLSKQKFKLRVVQPVDMFPHTSHVESIALVMKEK